MKKDYPTAHLDINTEHEQFQLQDGQMTSLK